MPVPTAISELSTTPGSNSPVGSDSPSSLDNHIRALAAFIRQLSDEKAAIANTVLLTGSQTVAGAKTFSSNIVGNLTGNASGTAANVTGTVAVANGGTGATSAANAFAALKQVASTTATGVVELATDAEAQAGTDATRAVTPDNLGATVIGMGQTWQNVTASRAAATNYTNSTGRPIFVAVRYTQSGSGVSELLVDGLAVGFGQQATVGGGQTLAAIVPNGSVYRLNQTGNTIGYWTELR